MNTPANYPYAYTYLLTHISRLSRGFVLLVLAALVWVFVIAVVSGVWQLAEAFIN